MRKILTGVRACKGSAKGIAKIVKTVEDVKKVSKENVLIAEKTTPFFMPAMLKAKALVTEEGGYLSHAAIFSREIGLPCIVKVSNLLKEVKNNDIIEIDESGFEVVISR